MTGQESVALVKDDGSDKIPLVRVHSECLTGDIFHSLKCDCNYQLHSALDHVYSFHIHRVGALNSVARSPVSYQWLQRFSWKYLYCNSR